MGAGTITARVAPRLILSELYVGTIRLHHESGRQDCPAQKGDPEGHLALVFPGREDRRARAERGREIDSAQDHGGHRYRDSG